MLVALVGAECEENLAIRFLIPVTKTDLERYRRRVIFDDSHIREMIHAPLD